MFCSNCGAELSSDAKFCANCGQPTSAGASVNRPVQDASSVGPLEQRSGSSEIALWNPSAAANWSLVLTPVFGSFLHGRNWQALGEFDKAAKQRMWTFATTLAALFSLVVVHFGVSVEHERVAAYGVSLLSLLAWYFASAREQIKFVKDNVGPNYSRKGWIGPILIAVVLLIFASMIALLLIPRARLLSSETASDEMPSAGSSSTLVQPAASNDAIDQGLAASPSSPQSSQDATGASANAAAENVAAADEKWPETPVMQEPKPGLEADAVATMAAHNKENDWYCGDVVQRGIYHADLTDDGVDDIAVVLGVEGNCEGGNTTSLPIAIFIGPSNSPAIHDQLIVKAVNFANVKVDGDTLIFPSLSAGPNDANCCPSIKGHLKVFEPNGTIVQALGP